MSCQRILTTVLLGVLPLGCSAASLDDAQSIDAPGLMETDINQTIVSTNGLFPGLLTDPTLVQGMMDLADGKISIPTSLVETKDGRLLLGHITHCALANSDSIIVTDSNGQDHQFFGHLGLAGSWKDKALDASGRRWVSACLLAHANSYGINVTIDLRGTHTALSGAPDPNCTEQEASFYGDLFGAKDFYACIGSSPSSSGTHQRVCGRTQSCGFSIIGTCGLPSQDPLCTPTEPGSDVFASCLAPTDDERMAPVEEVITVYAAPGAFGIPKSCPHAPDKEGWPLSTTCSKTVKDVCAVDPYCCETDWDKTCVSRATNGFPMPTIP